MIKYEQKRIMSTPTNIVNTIELIRELLNDAHKYGLAAEVTFYALQAMKRDPTITYEVAIYEGYYEWIK